MNRTYRTLIASALLVAMSAPAFASAVAVKCSDGTRNEPVPPTIIPGYTEVVPDILHPAVYGTDKVVVGVNPGKQNWHAGREVCVYPNGMRNISLMPDCLTMWDTKSLADTKRVKKVTVLVAEEYTEIVPDIEHPEQVIENPDLVIPTKTVTYLTVHTTRPFIRFEEVTSDGSCPS
jgi:hypothetical protein